MVSTTRSPMEGEGHPLGRSIGSRAVSTSRPWLVTTPRMQVRKRDAPASRRRRQPGLVELQAPDTGHQVVAVWPAEKLRRRSGDVNPAQSKIRELWAAHPGMPATVTAERVGLAVLDPHLRRAAFSPCGGDNDLMRHLLAPGSLGRQHVSAHIRRRSSEGGRPRFKGGTSRQEPHSGALTRLAAVAISTVHCRI